MIKTPAGGGSRTSGHQHGQLFCHRRQQLFLRLKKNLPKNKAQWRQEEFFSLPTFVFKLKKHAGSPLRFVFELKSIQETHCTLFLSLKTFREPTALCF
ncbi:MAG: hypothetical protein LBD21_05525 [Tannerellaceae bacterium]|jgi:hypothetical protein|nr:hypothetical protein [Tannerellaceae bacterium]